jgi:hypothetical protein
MAHLFILMVNPKLNLHFLLILSKLLNLFAHFVLLFLFFLLFLILYILIISSIILFDILKEKLLQEIYWMSLFSDFKLNIYEQIIAVIETAFYCLLNVSICLFGFNGGKDNHPFYIFRNVWRLNNIYWSHMKHIFYFFQKLDYLNP